MSAPKGFRKVTFDLQSPDGKDKYRVSCLVCDICQAMVLQNVPQDFAAKHRDWHDKEKAKDILVERLQAIYESAKISGTKESLNYMTQGDAHQ